VTEPELAAVDRRRWLNRLIYVRIVAFSVFILIPWFTGKFADPRDVDMLLGAIAALSVIWIALLHIDKHYVAQSYAQIILDLLLITWTVNRTGGVDSYVSNLYFLEIVMSSILLERRGAFIGATLSSVLHLAHLDLVKYGALPGMGSGGSDWSELQFIISLNILGFCAVAYLSNYLAARGRTTGEIVRPDGVPQGIQQPHHRQHGQRADHNGSRRAYSPAQPFRSTHHGPPYE
jgi:hypothetical protein